VDRQCDVIIIKGHILSTAAVNGKEIDRAFTVSPAEMIGWGHDTCHHFVALSWHEDAFSFHL